MTKSSGIQPRLRGMPRPLQREVYLYWFLGGIASAAVVAVGLYVSFVLAGAFGGLITAIGGTWCDRRFRRLAGELSTTAPVS